MEISGNYPRGTKKICCAITPKGAYSCGRADGHPGSHLARVSVGELIAIWDDDAFWFRGDWYENRRIERTVLEDNWVKR